MRRERRQAAPPRRIEQAVALERGPGPLEREPPRAVGVGAQQLGDGEAELRLLLPHGGRAEDEDLLAVGGRRAQAPVVARPHHAAQLRPRVAQREVPVAALVGLEGRDLAADPDRAHPLLDDGARPPGHLAHRPGALAPRGVEQA
jgi:hypothetical protein